VVEVVVTALTVTVDQVVLVAVLDITLDRLWVLELQTKDMLVVLHDLLHILAAVVVVLVVLVVMLPAIQQVVMVVLDLELLSLDPHILLEPLDLDQPLVDG
tara:strand:+ start:452 stop:754 length:303 start_codon:yes stop_codon:yes gene_type:complete